MSASGQAIDLVAFDTRPGRRDHGCTTMRLARVGLIWLGLVVGGAWPAHDATDDRAAAAASHPFADGEGVDVPPPPLDVDAA